MNKKKKKKTGNVGSARQTLLQGLNVNSKDSFRARTALHWSALSGHNEMVELLLQHGALINEKDNDGNTALNLAASRGRDAVVQKLLLFGGLAKGGFFISFLLF